MSNNYDIFLSYRHKPLDEEVTRRVFNALESYRLPKALKERGCQDIERVFRDTEELAVREILTETIDEALRSTNCLVVVCSTDTPDSPWVDREVAMFIRMGRAEHIYPLLISGDPERSFPPSLKLVPDVMDRLMDVRGPDNDPKKIMARVETALPTVIAAIAGCDDDDLVREHTLRRNRRFAAGIAAALCTMAVIVGVSAGLMKTASAYRDTARLREQASMRILNELTYSLPDHLTNVPGAYSRIESILRRNTEDLNAIARLSENREAAEFEAAANYEKLASAERVLGAYDEALSSENDAIAIFEELAKAGYEGSPQALASAYNNRGGILSAAGRYDEAAYWYEQIDSTYEATNGARMTFDNIALRLSPRYSAYRKAGRNSDALTIADSISAAIDSALVWQKKNDANELAVIYQTHEKELALEESEAKATVYRILAVVAFLICLFVAYMFWWAAQNNKVLFEKNRRLLAEMEQREREQKQAIEQLKAEPEELLTANQKLFRSICALMNEQKPFTDENLNRDSLAQLLGTNPKYIDQAINECSNGDTTRDFINRYRVQHIATLLKATDDSIGLIGEMSGIASRATLSRLFRDYYGMTPSEYRQAARAELKQN